MKRYGGIVAVLVSAFLFGVTPVLGKLTYSMGSNALMLTFLRGSFAIPVLFVILKIQRIPLGLTRRELRDVLVIGFVGSAPTGLLLYSSYNYIPVGLATVLHFLFPVVVTLASIIVFKSKVNVAKIVALVLGTAGVVMFFEGATTVAALGFVLALASAVTYTIYILGVERTSLAKMHYFKLSFYFSICSAVLSGVFALATGNMTFSLTPLAWLYSFLVSMLVAIGAFTLLQVGITLCGATTASILSTLEPITGVAAGMLVLGETLTTAKVVGCVVILAGVLLVTISEGRGNGRKEKDPA